MIFVRCVIHLQGNWKRNCDIISRKFDSLELNDSVVEQVLLELKEPSDVKSALGFFDLSTKRKNVEHGIRSHCTVIHILVLQNKHSFKIEEELCLCTYTLFWVHGPNIGNLTTATIENICKVQPTSELDPVVASFLKMAKERIEFISCGSLSMSKGVAGWEMVAYRNEDSNTACRLGPLGYFERLRKETRCAKRSVIKVCSSEVSFHNRRMEDSDLGGKKNQCMILIGNLDKELHPSTIAGFLHRETSILPRVYIFPSLSSEVYTRGAIVLDSEKDFQKLCDFLNNPSCIIISSSGRMKAGKRATI